MKLTNITGPVLALALTGCASISVKQDSADQTNFPPQRVYVEAFTTSGGDWRVDRDGDELTTFKKDLQLMMKTGITVDLSKRLIPASTSDGVSPATKEHAWLVRGEFVRVYQGSRLLRGTIGFGAGATKLETRVHVYDLTSGLDRPFLVFETTGGSNSEPGMLPSLATDPLSLLIDAAGGAGNVAHGLTEDTNRTAREITAELSDYMYHHGWISKDTWIEPKHYTP